MSPDAERLARVTRERCATIPLPVEWSHPFFRSPLADAVFAIDNLLAALAARDAECAQLRAVIEGHEACAARSALEGDRLRARVALLAKEFLEAIQDDHPAIDTAPKCVMFLAHDTATLLAPPVPTGGRDDPQP